MADQTVQRLSNSRSAVTSRVTVGERAGVVPDRPAHPPVDKRFHFRHRHASSDRSFIADGNRIMIGVHAVAQRLDPPASLPGITAVEHPLPSTPAPHRRRGPRGERSAARSPACSAQEPDPSSSDRHRARAAEAKLVSKESASFADVTKTARKRSEPNSPAHTAV